MKHSRKVYTKPTTASKRTTSTYSKKTTRTSSRKQIHKNDPKQKPIYCNGCNRNIDNFKSTRDFIRGHSILSQACQDSLYHCQLCSTSYYKEDDRSRHFSHSRKCLNFFCKQQEPKKYCTSQVQFVPVTNLNICLPTSSCTTSSTKIMFNHVNPKNTFSGVNSFLTGNISKSFSSTQQRLTKLKKHISLLGDTSSLDITSTHTKRDSSHVNQDKHDTSVSMHSGNSQNDSNIFQEIPLNQSNDYDVVQCNDDFSIATNRDTEENHLNDIHNNVNYDMQEVTHIPNQQLTILNTNHLLQLKHIHKVELSSIKSDTDYEDALQLVQILLKKKQSLTSYDEFMKWKHSTHHNKSYYSLSALKKTALNRVYGETIGKKMFPKKTVLECPSSGRRVYVVTTDIDAILFDMLSDKELTCQKNLIFADGDITDPFRWTMKDNYDDFDQSGFYNNSVREYITNRNTQLLVPICIYMDETTLDSFGKLSLHPVVMTLMIYNRSTRNLDMTWRTIGYMPNFNEMVGTKNLSPEEKLNDFHFVLRYILNGIEKLQSIRDGLDWEFEFPEYPNRTYKRTLKFPISHIIGDAKGNDTLCGRFQSRTKTKYLCRDCDVLTQESDNPQSRCNFFQFKNLQGKTKEEMEELCFRKINPYNAFVNIWFGSNPYGLNGACPPDPLHQINKGIPQRLPNCFLKERLSINLVKQFDCHVAFICTHYCRQSDRDIPELRFFKNGVSEDSKLSGEENIGRLFAMYLTLLTCDFEKVCVGQKGRKIDKDTPATIITQTEYNNWILVFEETLILVAWVYFEKHPKVVFKGGRNSVVVDRMRLFMNTFKEVANRTGGMGWKLLKFHQLLHLWIVIRLFSSLPNVDSARNESHHKKKKSIASHTQRRLSVLDKQTAEHEFEYNLLIKAMKNAYMSLPDVFEMQLGDQKENSTNMNEEQNVNSGTTFNLTFNYNKEIIESHWNSKSNSGKECNFPSHVLASLYSKLNNYNHGHVGKRIKSISGFTERRIINNNSDSVILRACPNYRSGLDWFDWATIDWGEEEGFLEAHLLMFLNMKSMKFDDYLDEDNVEPHDVIDHDVCVLIHSIASNSISSSRQPAKATEVLYNPERGPISKLCKFCKMEETYQLIDIECITGECFVLIDELNDDRSKSKIGNAKSVITVSRRRSWHLSFLDYNSQAMLDEAALRTDDNIEEDDVRFMYES